MPNPRYQKGVRLERELVKSLKKDGAQFVSRTPGSKTPVDVIALMDGLVSLYQCKTGKAKPTKKELAYLRWLQWRHVECYVVLKKDGVSDFDIIPVNDYKE